MFKQRSVLSKWITGRSYLSLKAHLQPTTARSWDSSNYIAMISSENFHSKNKRLKSLSAEGGPLSRQQQFTLYIHAEHEYIHVLSKWHPFWSSFCFHWYHILNFFTLLFCGILLPHTLSQRMWRSYFTFHCYFYSHFVLADWFWRIPTEHSHWHWV